MARYSANNKTIEWARAQGFELHRVELFNPFSGSKRDFMGIIDYIGITQTETIGVQSCGPAFSEHFRTIVIEQRENTKLWLSGPGRKLVLIAWRKVKRRGRMVYRPRIIWFEMVRGRLVYGPELSE